MSIMARRSCCGCETREQDVSNPYELRARKHEYNELREAMQTVTDTATREDRDLTEAELRQVKDYEKRGTELYDQIQDLKADEQRSRKTEDLAGSLITGQGGSDFESLGYRGAADPLDGVPGRTFDGPPALLPGAEQMAELHRSAVERRPVRLTVAADRGTQDRAAVTVDSAGGNPATGLRVPSPVVSRRIASRFRSQPVAGATTVNYPVFGSESGQASTSEGGTKPEGVDVAAGSATPVVLARWKTVSNQTVKTYADFAELLQSSLTSGVVRDENKLIVDTITGNAGVQVLDDSASGNDAQTSILTAIGMLADSDTQGFDLVLANPADLPALFSTAVANSQVNPQDDLRMSLFGAPVFVGSAVTAGTVIVGASSGARWVVGDEPNVLVDPYSELKTNQSTIRLEESAALALPVPDGFVNVTLDAS